MRRTSVDLVQALATKLELEPSRVQKTIHTKLNGLSVLVDDDVVRELPEGQDMLVEVSPIKAESLPSKREWDSGPNDTQVDGDLPTLSDVNSAGLELKLIF